MKAWILPLGLLAGVGLVGSQVDPVREETNPPVRLTSLDAHDESASASLLGQFRTSITAWLWVHTDLYLHNGVQMRPITQAERRAGVEIAHSAKDGHEELHKDIAVTVIPAPERDFRGIFGDVERATGAYKDMRDHAHNDPKQSLPLYRLMTWLDPQFVDGWTNGAMVIARDRTPAASKKALDFLLEGLKENPTSADLLATIGYTYLSRLKDLSTAVVYLRRAIDAGAPRLKSMSDAERDGLENAFRWLALCYRDLGNHRAMVDVCAYGSSLFPDDKILPRLEKG